MRISLVSVMVDDQAKALSFYTEKLGFALSKDMPAGGARWLTVVSPEGPDNVEVLLEPMGFEPAKGFQKALRDAGIPWTAFASKDVHAEYERLRDAGVEFMSEPTAAGPTVIAVFDDTCGNLIQIYQE